MSIQPVGDHKLKKYYDTKNTHPNIHKIQYHLTDWEAGKSLYFEGDDADFIFEIVKGVSRLSKVSPEGKRKILTFGFKGHILGKTNSLKYSHDCCAITALKVRVYRKTTFNNLVENDSEFCRYFFEKSIAEIDLMYDHFMMINHKSAYEKIASFLCELMKYASEKNGNMVRLSLPMKRTDIADFLGLTIETVSRNLSRLKEEGIIELSKCKLIDILEPRKLRKVACLITKSGLSI